MPIHNPEDIAFLNTLEPAPDHWGGTGAVRLIDDTRDRAWPVTRLPDVADILAGGLPTSVDNLADAQETWNQGAEPSCVPYSTGMATAINDWIADHSWDRVDCSRLYHEMGGNGQSGVDSRGTAQHCIDDGAPLFSGGRIKLGSYLWVTQVPGTFRQEVAACIAARRPVCVAMLLPSSFGWRSSGNPTTGYHQMCGLGYTGLGDSDYCLFKNSWGSGFGQNGNVGVPWGFLEANSLQNRYVFALLTAGGSIPPPPPPPPPVDGAATLFLLTNQLRVQRGAQPLTRISQLDAAAAAHARDMGQRRFFDHTNPDGLGPLQRMQRAGWQGTTWGENIAAGNADPNAVYAQWLNSPGHYSNMINPAYNMAGMALVNTPGSPYGWYAVQDFGVGDGGPPPPPPPVRLTVNKYTPNPVTAGQPFVIEGAGFAGGNPFARFQGQDLGAVRLSDTQLQATALLLGQTVTAPVTVNVEGTFADGPPLTIKKLGDDNPPPPPPGALDIVLIGRKYMGSKKVGVWCYVTKGGRPVNATVVGGCGTAMLEARVASGGLQTPVTWMVNPGVNMLGPVGITVTASAGGDTGTKAITV